MGGKNSKSVYDIESQANRVEQQQQKGQAGAAVKTRQIRFMLPRQHLQKHTQGVIGCLTQGTQLISDYLESQSISSLEYRQTLEELRKSAAGGPSQKQFRDRKFPPESQSLSKDIKSFEQGNGLMWARASEFASTTTKPLAVFQESVKPTDIMQGDLGDCYLLSALSSMAEKPGLIERLFETKEVSLLGIYSVWLCHDGEWQLVVIDDYFPCPNSQPRTPAFSTTNENELWAIILEKAYAKVYGAYDKIEGGLAGHAIHDLTGAPYHYFSRGGDGQEQFDEESIWEYIYTHTSKNNYIVTASSEENSRDGNVKGIVSNHSYSILDAREVVDSAGKKDRIIQIRNPWGQFEWKGDWCDESTRWTASLTAELGLSKSNDGVFWMSVSDFNQQFSQLMTSKIEDNFVYSSLRSSKAGGNEKVTQRVFTMKVSASMQRCHIGVTQKDKRNFAKDKKFAAYNYSLTRIIIASSRTAGGVNEFVAGEMECERDVSLSIEETIEAGVYLVYVEVDWNEVIGEVRDFVVWCYAEHPVEFVEVEVPGRLDGLVDDLLEAHREVEENERVHRYNDSISRTSGSLCGYVYFLYENSSIDVRLREEILMKSSQHLDSATTTTVVAAGAMASRGGRGVRVAPGERQILKYRANKTGRGVFAYQSSVKYILLQQVDPREEERLMGLALLQPSKVKQREMHGQLMKVFVHTFVYYGGVCFLYINKTSKKTYVEELMMDAQNLKSDAHDLNKIIYIEVPPQQSRLLNLSSIDPEAEIQYQPKITYYLR